MPHDPDRATPDPGLRVVWSQHPMLKRTAMERWFARKWRRAALVLVFVAGWACAVVVTGSCAAEQILHPPRRPLTAADAARARTIAARTHSQLSGESLRAADSAVLRAWWFVPRAKPRGTVVVLHGQADNRAAMLGLAELLLTDGYRVLAPDERAHGTSGGALATYGVLERVDLRAWADWAQRQFPDECVFAAGSSMGAAILIQTVPDVPFCAAVADSPFADLPSLARRRIGMRLRLPRALDALVAGPIVSAAMWYTRLLHGVPLSAASPIARFPQSRVPVLIVHGTADREVSDADSRALAAANPRFATLWLVDSAAHTQAWATAPREYPARVLRFLAAHQ